MKKQIFFRILIFIITCIAHADIDDYFLHCNLSIGGSFIIDGEIKGAHGTELILTDGFGDYYRFKYDPDTSTSPKAGGNITFSLPFYYKPSFSIGLFGQCILNGGFINPSSIINLEVDIYSEYK